MSLAETHSVPYDDARARRALAKCIKVHEAKLAELADMRAAISDAERKLATMQESINKTAGVEDALSEVAAEALRRDTDVSQRSAAWKAKENRDALIAEHALLTTGFARLQARASGLENEVKAEHDEVRSQRVRARAAAAAACLPRAELADCECRPGGRIFDQPRFLPSTALRRRAGGIRQADR
jgi:hypothetical protein